MDLVVLALAKKYADSVGEEVSRAGFKVQIEPDRSILETVGQEKIFYFLPKNTSKPQDGYDEYIYAEDWEQVGVTDVDLSAYATQTWTAEQLAQKAGLDSPIFTGTPQAPTPENGTYSDQIATTAFVMNQLAATVIVTVTPARQNIVVTLSNPSTGKSYTETTNENGVAYISVRSFGKFNISYRSDGAVLSQKTIDIQEAGEVYAINAQYVTSQTYTVAIDLNNSNPLTAVTYADDAVGTTKGSDEWDNKFIFRDIKPCMLKNGEVQYYLDKNNFNLQADGITPAVLDGTDGDVMIEIPKFGYRLYKDTEDGNNILYVSITNNPAIVEEDPRYSYYAFTREEAGDLDYFYWGAYKGWLDSQGKLRSLPGKTPANNRTLAAFKQTAKLNGERYSISSYFQLVALQCLYLIKYGNLDSQNALGRGNCSTSAAIATGGTEDWGMYGGVKTDSASHVKFAGIEDFWGNFWEWVDGLTTDANRNVVTTYDYDGTYEREPFIYETGLTSNRNGWVKNVIGTTEAGFMNIDWSGSETTYFCDYGYLAAGGVLVFGGRWDDGGAVGPFCLDAGIGPEIAYGNFGARLTLM